MTSRISSRMHLNDSSPPVDLHRRILTPMSTPSRTNLFYLFNPGLLHLIRILHSSITAKSSRGLQAYLHTFHQQTLILRTLFDSGNTVSFNKLLLKPILCMPYAQFLAIQHHVFPLSISTGTFQAKSMSGTTMTQPTSLFHLFLALLQLS